MNISRRTFLATSLCGLLGLGAFKGAPIPGRICGANHSLAHRRGAGRFPSPTIHKTSDVLIVGGGVAGLSAARRLRAAGIERISMVELESSVGGNSLGGHNAVSSYPWGAHYLPLPNNSNASLLEFLRQSDVVSLGAKPRYEEEYLCASPQERLYIYGKWQEGLVPQRGVDNPTRDEIARFHQVVEEYRQKRGRDGRYYFDIPVRESSTDPEALRLDSFTMRRWMDERGFVSPELRWYVNYCCRDDYGTSFDEASAWAGLHYFASRRADVEGADPHNVLTWSEGNYWLVRKLREQARPEVLSGSLVYGLESSNAGVRAHCFDGTTQESYTIEARACVLAVPHFVRARLCGDSTAPKLSYAPWLVANVTLTKPPQGAGAPLSWDNVVYGSTLLGYVHAGHQSLSQTTQDTVITYYYPMSEYPPDLARMVLYNASLSELQGEFLREIERVHPELHGDISSIDVWIWGHAMSRPTPHTIWPTASNEERLPAGTFAAHSDQSGISIFEEAFYQGIVAGERVMNYLGQGGASWA